MPTLERVRQYLAGHGVAVLTFDQPTPTAETAAAAVGCSPAEIAKSITFLVSGAPLLIVTSGDMKVKSSRLKQVSGRSGKVKLAGAAEVVAATGYPPGGVCPFLLPPAVPVLIDRSLRRFPQVYAAAGNANSAVPITVEQLLALTGGVEVEVCTPLAD
jgi:prolyl-tRNA editing enzyme YbaK/EbsC (Cys-tRNA(Pro) deacylase)